jgi:hypothetical protein
MSERQKDNERSLSDLTVVNPDNDGRRCEISGAKQSFLNAVLRILEQQREYWPLSDRQIHYQLLGPDAPLTHASKADSRYVNDKLSYHKLTDLLTRGRIAELIPWQSIDDETQPTDLHSTFGNTAEFFRQEVENFLTGELAQSSAISSRIISRLSPRNLPFAQFCSGSRKNSLAP